MFLADFLCPDTPDHELVDALENVGIVHEVLPLQIDELTLDMAIVQLYNFGPHILAYSASTCDRRIDHSLSSELFKHCTLMGTRTLSFALRCPGATFRADPSAGFWRADVVLVDEWGPVATARWLEAGVRIAWLGHAVPAQACADSVDDAAAPGADSPPHTPAAPAAGVRIAMFAPGRLPPRFPASPGRLFPRFPAFPGR